MLLFCGVLETGACCHTGNLCYNLTESVHFIFQYIIQYHNKIKAHLHTFRNTELHDKYIIIGAGCHSFEVQVVTWVLNVCMLVCAS